MKKMYIGLLSCMIMVSSIMAQNDPAAKKVLDAVSNNAKSFKGVTASFTIKSITSKGKDNGTKTGSISIKGQKYTLKQGKTQILCDGKKIYNYDGSKTVTVSAVDDAGQTLSPQNLLSNFYDKDFTYKLLSSAGGFYQVELLPNDKRKNFQKVTVFIDKAKNMITRAQILDKSNNTVEFILTNPNTNATLADNLFTFDKSKYPADVEILD